MIGTGLMQKKGANGPGNAYREMFMSEIDTNQLQAKAGNRPTMATGMLEDNSSIQDGHPEFELIGSDFVPSQKAGEASPRNDENVASSPFKVNINANISSKVKSLTPGRMQNQDSTKPQEEPKHRLQGDDVDEEATDYQIMEES